MSAVLTCPECEDGWQDCGTGTYDHGCATCKTAGVIASPEAVEAVAVRLALELGHTMASIDPPKAAPNTVRAARAALGEFLRLNREGK